MDEIDIKIIRALQNNSRIPFLELSKEIGVSDATVHKRVKNLMDAGIIKSFETRIDDRLIGLGLTAFIEIKVRPGTIEQVSKKLKDIQGIVELHEIHGHCDLLVKIKVAEFTELRDKLVKEIRIIKEIRSSEVLPVLKVIKDDSTIPINTIYEE